MHVHRVVCYDSEAVCAVPSLSMRLMHCKHLAALFFLGRHFAQSGLLQWSFASGRAFD